MRTRAGYGVEGLEDCRPELHTDLPRLRAEGLGAQFWSVYVSSKLPEPAAVVATLERIDAVYRLAARYPGTLLRAGQVDHRWVCVLPLQGHDMPGVDQSAGPVQGNFDKGGGISMGFAPICSG
ncbi:membrane dipeptidase [Streptomyces sp. NPDC048254]|uniref:membrane dipeptidase n=1 Tax=Streptomyces sp. NPDC048254 TaxID=3365525 RepID=UPI0037158DF6